MPPVETSRQLFRVDRSPCVGTHCNQTPDSGVCPAAPLQGAHHCGGEFIARVAAELGAPTILVNNAGVLRDNLLFKMSASDWDTVLDVHLRGSFLMSRAVQKHMVDAGFGRVVNLSSSSALGNRGQANYSAAKAGLQGFTKTPATKPGKFGITANSIGPGFIATQMTKATPDRATQKLQNSK
ncbi:SDR family NAD(P)-dependent oxidoreductase, partial [Kribbella solani]|uniref:SDR family NAD(P)-dependent oxidoreductase n=1 Tax=Kribbella solani TaxID=236067 RepID=UPI0029B8184D